MRFMALMNRFLTKIITCIRRISIFKRLVIAFLSIIIIPNLVIGYASFNIYSKDIEKEIIKNSTMLLDKIDTTLDNQLKIYEDISLELCLNEDINKLLKENQQMYLSTLSNSDTKRLYDENKKQIGRKLYMTSSLANKIVGLEIISTIDQYTQINYEGERRGISFKDRIKFFESYYYKKVVEEKSYPVWFDASMEKDLNYYTRNGIMLMRSILDPDTREALGVLVMYMKLEDILGLYVDQNPNDYSNSYILSDKGMYYIFNVENLRGVIIDKEIKNMIFQTQIGSKMIDINGREYMIVFQQSKHTSWSLVNITSKHEMLSSVYKIRNVIIIVTLLCVLFTGLLSYIVTMSISIPLKKLQKSMEQVNENNIEPGFTDTLDDEISYLGAKFNTMILRIKNLIDSIYKVELLKKKEEIRRKEAELDALQMQINPHFLYNTLDCIRWEIAMNEKGDGPVSQMVKAFADLLRLGTKKNTKLVTIEEEFEHIKAYIKVMEFKKNEHIKLISEISEDILHCYITKLTLQPLVENAILHGLRKNQDEAIIYINFFVKSKDLYIEVRDNGIGMDQQAVDKLNNNLQNNKNEINSIGLYNVNERIKLFFGQEYGLHIISEPEKGTRILIHLPYISVLEENKGEQQDV